MQLITFGHGTASADRIAQLLRSADVRMLIDVRTAPGSRRNPHVARAELERWLPSHGIGYRWEKRLGGFRRPSPDSPDVAWREPMFRGYAEHMRRPDFLAATKNLTKHEAYQLVSVAGNVAITQLVDRPVYGVHVKMPKSIFK